MNDVTPGSQPAHAAGETQTPEVKQRLMSLDALRGFDMFWIIGGHMLFPAMFALTGWGFWQVCESQTKHSPWHGFTAYDLIFPLFIFLSGVTLGLSPKRLDQLPWSQRRSRYGRAVRRLVVLIILGVVYNHGWGGGVPGDLAQVRWASVLGRIGIAWFVAAMLVWHTSLRTQIGVAITILLGYWFLLMAVAPPGGEAGVLSPQGSWNAWVDQHFLPGTTYLNRPYDPEGLLSNVPSIVNAMLGVLAGRWLMAGEHRGRWRRTGWLVVAGLVLLGLGWLWHTVFPVNKELWTSSFVLVTCGWSALLLAVFYGLIDAAGWQKLGWPLAVIGANALMIYLASSLVDWSYMAASLFGKLIQTTPAHWHLLLTTLSILLVQWVLLVWMYRRKIFIRI